MNKDNNSSVIEKRVITPEMVFDAFNHLPQDYVKQTSELLKKRFKEGVIKKQYSDRYIISVRNNERGAFNKDIAEALVDVGLENKKLVQLYGIDQKKAPVK